MDISNKEILEIIQELNEETKSILENKFEVINFKLDTYTENLSKQNMRINNIEEKINKIEKNEEIHFLKCPQQPKIEELKAEIERQKSIRNWTWKALTISSVVIGLFISIYKFLKG